MHNLPSDYLAAIKKKLCNNSAQIAEALRQFTWSYVCLGDAQKIGVETMKIISNMFSWRSVQTTIWQSNALPFVCTVHFLAIRSRILFYGALFF